MLAIAHHQPHQKQLTHRHNRHSTHPPVGASLLAIAPSAQNTKRAGNIGDLPKTNFFKRSKLKRISYKKKPKYAQMHFYA
ncbi:hypothetical protein [Pseudomonas thivervalensis]|uniref:hypothetical protein n=1 Tax=Pseudomonas thivervalensis TaxID=86265 RepID=UPI001290104F|nr:hypothetical protein [Pseudomonas thivervalensis]